MTSFSFAGPPWTMHLAWKEVWTSFLSGLANSLINPNYLSISARILNLRIRSLSLILSLLKNALIIISTLDSLSAFPNPKLLLSGISLIKSFLNFLVGNKKLFHRLEDLSLSLAVSNAISTYHMSVYMIPKSICHKLDALMWKFWGRENQNGNSFIPKSWDTICISKFVGGLGFKRMIDTNRALISKMSWNLATSNQSLSIFLLSAKYLGPQSFMYSDSHPSNSS